MSAVGSLCPKADTFRDERPSLQDAPSSAIAPWCHPQFVLGKITAYPEVTPKMAFCPGRRPHTNIEAACLNDENLRCKIDSMSAAPTHMNRQFPPIQKQTENHLKIARNAEEISGLHYRIKETFRFRTQSDSARQRWEEACAEFHARYDLLAFPGGLNEETFFDQLGESYPVITEWALCFLELRPISLGLVTYGKSRYAG
jgi:hypothetical protein